jgi:hypothetical protein
MMWSGNFGMFASGRRRSASHAADDMSLAFYPCCSKDIEEPLELLRDFAEEVVFCDMNASLRRRWKEIATRVTGRELPKASFLLQDARTAVDKIERIDVLFYRRDSGGEGGSGIFVLGDSFLPRLLRRFPGQGGYLISDGSNSRGSNFERMTRPLGLTKHGWHFQKAAEQPFLTAHGLHVVSVIRQESCVEVPHKALGQ